MKVYTSPEDAFGLTVQLEVARNYAKLHEFNKTVSDIDILCKKFVDVLSNGVDKVDYTFHEVLLVLLALEHKTLNSDEWRENQKRNFERIKAGDNRGESA